MMLLMRLGSTRANRPPSKTRANRMEMVDRQSHSKTPRPSRPQLPLEYILEVAQEHIIQG